MPADEIPKICVFDETEAITLMLSAAFTLYTARADLTGILHEIGVPKRDHDFFRISSASSVHGLMRL